MKQINCRAIADEIYEGLKKEILELKTKDVRPQLAVILCEDSSIANLSYVAQKKKACDKLGIAFSQLIFEKHRSQYDMDRTVRDLSTMHIPTIIQLPVRPDLDPSGAIDYYLDPLLDVDGFGFLTKHIPCTPKGIMKIIDHEGVNLDGKKVLVIGRSDIVGKPVAKMCQDRNATVMVTHSHTKPEDLHEIMRYFPDIIISAVGIPGIVDTKYLDPHRELMIIDVGITKDESGHLCGDFRKNPNDEHLWSNISYTTVPGGVGPMTVACLMENVVDAYKNRG